MRISANPNGLSRPEAEAGGEAEDGGEAGGSSGAWRAPVKRERGRGPDGSELGSAGSRGEASRLFLEFWISGVPNMHDLTSPDPVATCARASTSRPGAPDGA